MPMCATNLPMQVHSRSEISCCDRIAAQRKIKGSVSAKTGPFMSRKTISLFITNVLVAICFVTPSIGTTPQEVERITQQVLDHAIMVDTHEDTPQMILDEGYDLDDPHSPFMVSIPKMREGHLGAAFFSIWVDVKYPRHDVVKRALDLMDATYAQVAAHPGELGMATTADDIVRLHGQGKIAILMGVEGGHEIEDDLGILDSYFRLGARYMTLTHTADTDWADSSGDKPRWNGLTDFGRHVVARMNRLGMMVDISHVSDQTFYDVIASTKAPVIASHSSCRALVNAPRDMTDDMIRALAKNGGVIQINFYPAFLDQKFAYAYAKVAAKIDSKEGALEKQYANDRARMAREIRAMQAREQAGIPRPNYTRIADHVDHAVQVGGIDHVGIGSDFDGIDNTPVGMEDVSKIPTLVRELARRGYSEGDIEKIMGGNLLRVMRQVEEVSRQMQTTKE
jgi:membrane dipeptidase